MEWIKISDELPPIGERILFTCFLYELDGLSGYYTDVNTGVYNGEKTAGTAIVMHTEHDKLGHWEPCSHWMPLPETPAIT